MMKSTINNIQHLQGEQAYQIYWEQYYHCKPRLSSIMAIDLNLEIVVDDKSKLLAYRYDLPADISWMVLKAGRWQIVNEDSLCPELLVEVRKVIIKSKYNICSN